MLAFIRYTILAISMMTTIIYQISYAAALGHITVMDPILGPRDIVYEKIDGYGIAEGDIIIQQLAKPTEENKQKPQALILLKLGGARWSQGIVPYEMSNSLPLPSKIAILEAMDTWQRSTHIKFVEVDPHREYADYLAFVPGSGTTCSSFVGKQGGAQVVILASRCATMNIAHEIGHALGLWHEQSRGDRDKYIQIVWDNIDENYLYNFNQHLSDGQDFGDYDYQSIMHYTAYAFSKNGERTIVPLQDNIEIGQRDHLSNKDIAAVNAMYPGFN